MSQDNNSKENLSEKNFKAIIALKDESTDKEGAFTLPKNLECRISVGGEIKVVSYPVKETVFIDLEHLDANTPFTLVFFLSQAASGQQEQILGKVTVNIPQEVTNHEEVEIKQSFSLSSSYQLKGSFLIIILNRIAFINNSSSHHEDGQVSYNLQQFDQQDQQKNLVIAQPSTLSKNNLLPSSAKDVQESAGIVNSTKQSQVTTTTQKSVEALKQKNKSTAVSVSALQSRKDSLGKGSQSIIVKQETTTITKQTKSTTSTTPLRQRAAAATTTTNSNASQAQLMKQKQSQSKDNKVQEENERKGKTNQKMERYEKKLKFTPFQEQPYTATSWITHNRQDLAHDKESHRQKPLNNKQNPADGFRDNHRNKDNTISNERKEQNNSESQRLEQKNQENQSSQVEQQQRQENSSKEWVRQEQTEKEGIYSNKKDQILRNTKPQIDEKYPQPAVLTVERNSQLESERHSHSFGDVSEPQGQQNWQLSRSGNINFSAASGIQKENGQQQEAFPQISEFPLTAQKSLSQSPIRHSRYSPISKRSREASPIPLRRQLSSNRKSPGKSPSQGGNALSVLLNLEGSRRQQKLDEETMKLNIFTMQSKLKRMSIIEEENEQLRAELQISEDSRKELSKVLENQIELEQASKQEIEISSRQVSAEKNELLQTLTVKNSQLNQLARQYDEAVLQLKEYERKNIQLSNEISSFSSLKQITQSYREELSQMSIRLNSSSHDFEERFTVLYREMAVLENEKAQLSKVNQELSTSLQTIELDNNQLRQLNLQKQYEIESLLRKLSIQTAYEDGLKINQAQVQAVELQLREERRIKEEQVSKIVQLEKELENLRAERDEERVRYHEDLELLRGAVDKQKETISKQSEQLDEASRMGVYAQRESNQQDVLNTLLREARRQAENEKTRRENQELECNSFKKLNVDLEQVLQTQYQEIQQLRNNLKELASIVDEGEQNTANLRFMLFNQSGNQAHPSMNTNYQPATDDTVDKCLGAFLNEHSHSLPAVTKQLFVRESSGVYQFGSKRVFVKAENDRIQVRTGGGFISLEEFLDLYTPSEVDKLQRNHPLAKLSSNYALNKKLSQSKCLSEIKEPADVQVFDPAFSQKQSMIQ